MTYNCGNCTFYIKEPLRPGYGECHKAPPSLIPAMAQHGGVQTLGAWPPTQEKFWCGEHKTKTNGFSGNTGTTSWQKTRFG